ncbi:MAG: hypothetical protein BWK75_04490 [Candidatus Altiarchaeales archaeon A3]|nr:MAG: hypothetical protein BWK75_04490 [Candidatus Altiarchaeales archaeon A3]
MKKYILLLVVLAALIAIVQNAEAQLSSSNYQIELLTLNSGGGNLSSSNYCLFAAVGESATGNIQSSSYTLRLGIFHPIRQLSSCYTPYDFDGNDVVDIFDAVAALEYLSAGNPTLFNVECSDKHAIGIDLFDVFDLIDKISI